jgi:hypothetical protein
LSKFNVFENLTKNYENILDVLKHRSVESNNSRDDKALAKELYGRFKDLKNVYLIFGLHEILSLWTSLLLRFQREEIDPSLLMKEIENFIGILKAKLETNQDSEVSYALQNLLSKNGHGINETVQAKLEFCHFMKEFSEILIENLHQRFPQTMLLKAARVLLIDDIMKERDPDKLVNFGVQDLRIVVEHFSQRRRCSFVSGDTGYAQEIIKDENVMREYTMFKFMIMYNHSEDEEFAKLSLHEKWYRVFALYGEIYKNFFQTIKLLLILPLSTVPCERLFSKKNLIKSRGRSCLKTMTLDHLLRCSLADEESIACKQREIVEHFLLIKDRFIKKYPRETSQTAGSKFS